MNAIVTKLAEVFSRRKPATAQACEELVATAQRTAGWTVAASPGPTGKVEQDELRMAMGPGPSRSPVQQSLPKWEKEISLTQADWLSQDNPATVARLKSESVRVEFS